MYNLQRAAHARADAECALFKGQASALCRNGDGDRSAFAVARGRRDRRRALRRAGHNAVVRYLRDRFAAGSVGKRGFGGFRFQRESGLAQIIGFTHADLHAVLRKIYPFGRVRHDYAAGSPRIGIVLRGCRDHGANAVLRQRDRRKQAAFAIHLHELRIAAFIDEIAQRAHGVFCARVSSGFTDADFDRLILRREIYLARQRRGQDRYRQRADFRAVCIDDANPRVNFRIYGMRCDGNGIRIFTFGDGTDIDQRRIAFDAVQSAAILRPGNREGSGRAAAHPNGGWGDGRRAAAQNAHRKRACRAAAGCGDYRGAGGNGGQHAARIDGNTIAVGCEAAVSADCRAFRLRAQIIIQIYLFARRHTERFHRKSDGFGRSAHAHGAIGAHGGVILIVSCDGDECTGGRYRLCGDFAADRIDGNQIGIGGFISKFTDRAGCTLCRKARFGIAQRQIHLRAFEIDFAHLRRGRDAHLRAAQHIAGRAYGAHGYGARRIYRLCGADVGIFVQLAHIDGGCIVFQIVQAANAGCMFNGDRALHARAERGGRYGDRNGFFRLRYGNGDRMGLGGIVCVRDGDFGTARRFGDDYARSVYRYRVRIGACKGIGSAFGSANQRVQIICIADGEEKAALRKFKTSGRGRFFFVRSVFRFVLRRCDFVLLRRGTAGLCIVRVRGFKWNDFRK